MTKKIQIQMKGRSDEFSTPPEAVQLLIPFISLHKIIWDCAFGKGILIETLKKYGYEAVGRKDIDFLSENNGWVDSYDIIITNPPYSKKYEFLKRCYEIGKPFALLMPLTALEGKKRQELYKKYGIQILIPNKRINFITPSGKGSGAWFQVAWFCYKFNLPKEINFE